MSAIGSERGTFSPLLTLVRSERPPSVFARAYPVNVEPGSSVVKGPYVAETLAVSVESDYVVVDL
jgi:hypothetical protein